MRTGSRRRLLGPLEDSDCECEIESGGKSWEGSKPLAGREGGGGFGDGREPCGASIRVQRGSAEVGGRRQMKHLERLERPTLTNSPAANID